MADRVARRLDSAPEEGMHHAEARWDEDPYQPEGSLRGRVAGQPPLPLLRARGRHRGLPRRGRPVPRHRRGRDRPRARPSRLPEAGGRPRHRQTERPARGEFCPRTRRAAHATERPIGPPSKKLAAAVAGETYEYTEMYPGMAKTARTEGFADVA